VRGTGAVPRPGEVEIGRIFREESGRSVAALIRVFGDIDVAEDAVQEAFTIALGKWPGDGLPPNPGGWITTTARNRAIDRLRRESRGRELLSEAAVLSPGTSDPAMPGEAGPVEDDRLRLIFTCCHPALSTEAQVALTLRLLGGLSTREVARSFLVTEHTIAVRLVRAKRKIKAARIPYRVPGDHELPGRLRPVLAVVYLVYNAGLTSPAEPGLCPESIRLARILATLMPDEPEVAGLLALLLLTESRRASRTRPDGSLVLLGEQDRGAWDRALIEEGQGIVRRCLHRNQPGAYQLQAAINAVHADAATASQTDWPQIAALYDQLLAVAPTQVVALNRCRLPARGQHGTDSRRAGLPQARRPGFPLRRPTGSAASHVEDPSSLTWPARRGIVMQGSSRVSCRSLRSLAGRGIRRRHIHRTRPSRTAGQAASAGGKMPAITEQISNLLHEAGETHHRVFRIVDGADDDWASWYADWLISLSELPALLGVKPVRSELVYLLVSLDKDYTAGQPGDTWESYYAQRILGHFSRAGS
jgi:RNA polymerase sigma-70 factor (ECF subfamily)